MWYEESVREKVTSLFISGVFCLIILSSAQGGEDFLSKYWKRPIQVQTSKFSLYPEACGGCHKEQYSDWKGSLHSRAVGPGLLGQLNPHKDPEFATSCYFCHAPMVEQSEIKDERGKRQEARDKRQEEYIKNPSFNNRLKFSGVSCAVCHLRGGKIYGPPARKDMEFKIKGGHNGFVEKDFFHKAEFCAACHQLNEGYKLNGKLLVNTYREWEDSIYGKNNITCQSCHMPNREHLWRGIHDQEMVMKGISIETVRHKNRAKFIITNTGVGHYFPTYTTPLVVVKGFMLDKRDKIIPNSVKETFIGRKVDIDLTREIFDTRLPSQKSFEFDYDTNGYYNDSKIVFEIWVYPDEFYNRFYNALLNSKDTTINRKEIEWAFKITENSGYRLFRKVL